MFSFAHIGYTPHGLTVIAAVTLPPDASGNWYGAGQGWTLKEQMPGELVERLAAIDDTLLPAAAQVAKLAEQGMSNGQAVPAEQAQPVYIRDEVAWKKLPGRE